MLSTPKSQLCETSSMVCPRACSETACIWISRHHRRECMEDLTSRIHTIILHNLERIKDEDEKKSRLRVKMLSVRRRVRGWVFLGDPSQWRWGCGISSLAKVAMHYFISIQYGLQLDSWSVHVIDIIIDSTLQLPSRVRFFGLVARCILSFD